MTMAQIIQTSVDAKGDVRVEFSGFTGRDCQSEEERLRRELVSLGLNARVVVSPKKPNGYSADNQAGYSKGKTVV
jgi:hypothetical protein